MEQHGYDVYSIEIYFFSLVSKHLHTEQTAHTATYKTKKEQCKFGYPPFVVLSFAFVNSHHNKKYYAGEQVPKQQYI
jgi:hypothetical protein